VAAPPPHDEVGHLGAPFESRVQRFRDLMNMIVLSTSLPTKVFSNLEYDSQHPSSAIP